MLCFGLNLPRVLPCAVATGHTAVGPLAPLGVFTSAETNCASNLLVKKSRSTWLTWSTNVKITKLHLELCIFWCSIQYTPVPTCSHLKPPKSPNNFAQVQSTGQGCSLHFFDSSAATCWACYILFQDLANLSPCLKFRKHVQKNRKRRYLYLFISTKIIFKNCWQYLQNLPTNSEELQKLPPAPPSHHPRPHQCTFSRHGRQPSPRPSFVSALHQRTFWSTWGSRKMNLVPENGGFVPQNSRSNGR